MNVRIYKPSKSAAQSGRGKSDQWVVEAELDARRGPEPLMGWTSAGDTLSGFKPLRFESLEKAMAFAQEKGWTYVVLPEHARKLRPRNYADNLKYIPPESGTSVS